MHLWAMDEVHFQQYGSRCRMWVPPEEKNPVLLHHPGRQSIGYFGAVRLRDGKFRAPDIAHSFERRWGLQNEAHLGAGVGRLVGVEDLAEAA